MARCDDHVHMLGADLPFLVIGEPAVWMHGLAPTGVKEADAGILVSHVSGRGFNRPPVRFELERALLPTKLDQIMNRPYEEEANQLRRFLSPLDFTGRRYLQGY